MIDRISQDFLLERRELTSQDKRLLQCCNIYSSCSPIAFMYRHNRLMKTCSTRSKRRDHYRKTNKCRKKEIKNKLKKS